MARRHHVNYTALKYKAKKTKQIFSKNELDAFKKWKKRTKKNLAALNKKEQELRNLIKIIALMIERAKAKREAIQDMGELVKGSLEEAVDLIDDAGAPPKELESFIAVKDPGSIEIPDIPENLIQLQSLAIVIMSYVLAIAAVRAGTAIVDVACKEVAKQAKKS